MKARTPWIYGPWLDLPFVVGPPFIVLGLVLAFPQWFGQQAALTEMHWLVLVLLIDVAHVYSTIYRTYLDRDAVRHFRFELLGLPLIAFVLMVLLYNSSVLWFWRCMAYLAVFHFVRQQYGFMRLYTRKEQDTPFKRRLDAVTIYAATLCPLLFWHLDYPRNFDWFVEQDMVGTRAPDLAALVLWSYAALLAVYLFTEVRAAIRSGSIAVLKNALVLGTAISWFFGIVVYNGDVTFTLFNVVGHGVPYMALVWAFGRKKRSASDAKGVVLRTFFSLRAVPLYLVLLFVLAYAEEGLWNSMVWKEHLGIFAPFAALPAVHAHTMLSFLVPLLSLPQVTHYIIDAFIWRLRKDRDGWQQVIFGRTS